ncbi:MAG TPA: hypothetical protein VFM34_05280 [Moraxellaceae bacterium]|nr:hypothetical protein [Moraxellaceae bacterium]
MNAELFCFYCLGALALTADYHSEFTAGAVYLGAALMWLGLCVLNAHLKRLIDLQMAYQDEEDGE